MSAENSFTEMPLSQLQDFLSRYTQLTEQCFNTCVWDFHSTRLKAAEETCAQRCVDKFTQVTLRVSERAQELQLSGISNPQP